MSDPGLYQGDVPIANWTDPDRLVPSPVGQVDGRILVTEDDALVYGDAPSGGGAGGVAAVPPGSGDWLYPLCSSTLTSATLTGAAASAHNRLTFTPIWVAAAAPVDRIAIEMPTGTADTGSVIRLGVWSDNNGRPGLVLAQQTVAADVTGSAEATIAITVGPGLVWCGQAWQQGTPTTRPTLRMLANGDARSIFGSADVSGTNPTARRMVVTGVTGAFTDNPTVEWDSIGAVPLLRLRRA